MVYELALIKIQVKIVRNKFRLVKTIGLMSLIFYSSTVLVVSHPLGREIQAFRIHGLKIVRGKVYETCFSASASVHMVRLTGTIK